MTRSSMLLACVASLAAWVPTPACANPPAPITGTLFEFPGSSTSPASATSAGFALADRWLGDEPIGNPAGRLEAAVSLSPVLLHMSRQDLRADNRRFNEEGAFVDATGGWIGGSIRSFSIGLYASQPVVRREDNAFERGRQGVVTEPAVIRSSATEREIRAGIAASLGRGPLRFGAAGEWTRRDDEYRSSEESAAPSAGQSSVEFSGEGFGFSAGTRFDAGGLVDPKFSLGAAFRFVPSLSLSGRQLLISRVQDDTLEISAKRGALGEAGLSARARVTPGLRVLAALSGRQRVEWRGLDAASPAAWTWSIAAEYRDPEAPWTVRFGLGREQQTGAPEPRSGFLGLGLGWRWEGSGVDVGVLHRSLERSGSPTSSDDRVVGSIHVSL